MDHYPSYQHSHQFQNTYAFETQDQGNYTAVSSEQFNFLNSHSHYDEELTAPQSTFVSPVTYDPVSGMYSQTIRKEDEAFLLKYGQRIEIPDPQSFDMGWQYHDRHSSKSTEQPTGFRYTPAPPEVYEPPRMTMAAVTEDDMLQYLASPFSAPAQVRHPPFQPVASSLSAANMAPMFEGTSSSTHPAVDQQDDELAQPHMIVPSQQALGAYMEELRRQHASSKMVRPFRPLADFWVSEQVPLALAPEMFSPIELQWDEDNLETILPEASSPLEVARSLEQEPPCSPDSLHSSTDECAISACKQKSPSPKASAPHTSTEHPPLAAASEKKPALACLFCRGRKIACGPPLPGSPDKTCNQCARRHLKCEYPECSNRGSHKRKYYSAKSNARINKSKANRKRSSR